ncbi:hypothetical protein [Mucilaginibacter sp.]|uniref:hypothetical protein n=1 Tax=Mucilaginibacter sp. TaxID=1882438 RepID=UPI00261E48CB|nr:hypothetical protein [Mucilaginibacter sp.]MDB5029721.1 hypothetical protein [Mucilaginibacter sp.]
MKRTTKRYVITTSALNCYSYRILSDGVDFSQYINNPILLWMHQRASGNTKDQILPLGRVVEIRRDGDAWTGQPEFDENDTFAMSIFAKYEAGVLNMLSIGAIPVEISDDPKYMLAGQTNPTVVKCKVTDVSCVDIGGNAQALPVQLFDVTGKLIALSYTGISSYLQLAKKGAMFSTNNHKQSTIDVVTNGVDSGKITEDYAEALLGIGHDDDSVKEILSVVKNAKISPDRLEGKIHKSVIPLVTKNWYELKNVAGDGTAILREHAPEVYKAKFYEKHDRLPATKDGKPL